MDDSNIKLWEQSSEDAFRGPLRKPKDAANANAQQQQHSMESGENVSVQQSGNDLENRRANLAAVTQTPQTEDMVRRAANSSLSVDAEEWYPRNFNISHATGTATTCGVQNRLNKYKPSSKAEPPVAQINDQNRIDADIRRFKSIISTLTNDPGQFDDLVCLFVETLSPYFNNSAVIQQVAQLLFSKAITEPNFRYTAARLCCLLEEPSQLFRSQMHQTCENEINSGAHQQHLLLFVAELYTQLKYGNIYAKTLLRIMRHLISLKDVDHLKSVCLALKLSGRTLDSCNREDMNGIFAQLETCRPVMNSSVMNLLNSVIQLRNTNWGQQEAQQSSSSEYEPDYLEHYGDQGFCCEDGHDLSVEEQHFLEDNLEVSHEFLGDESDPDELCDPEPEMDEEIQAAFKDFIKMSKR